MIAVASSYISYANIMLVLCGILIAFVSVIVVVFYNRDKKKIIQETTHNFMEQIAANEQMRNQLIGKILENEKFKQEFEAMIDMHIGDKFAMLDYENQETSNIGGLK